MEQSNRMHECIGELLEPRAVGQEPVLPVTDAVRPPGELIADECGQFFVCHCVARPRDSGPMSPADRSARHNTWANRSLLGNRRVKAMVSPGPDVPTELGSADWSASQRKSYPELIDSTKLVADGGSTWTK